MACDDTAVTKQSLHQLRTPSAAAFAGVAFALLFGTTLVLIRLNMPEGVTQTASWLDNRRDGILTATMLMPFAGISFLWFIAVIRDSFGRYEDRFFVSVFLGSGLLFLAMMFVASSVAAALVATNELVIDPAAHAEVANLGKGIVLAASKTYAIRMAAVFMISVATIWRKTGLMPGWLVIATYVVAVSLLIAGDVSMWVTMTFPVWVLVVSGLILVRAGVFDSHRESVTT